MTVDIVKDAYLIRVALELGDRNQAAAIVNAVVHAYLEYNGEHQRAGNSNLRNSLAEQLKKYKNEINEKRNELRKIVEKGKVTVTRPISPKSSKNSDDDPETDVRVSEEQSDRLARETTENKLEIIKVEAQLKT